MNIVIKFTSRYFFLFISSLCFFCQGINTDDESYTIKKLTFSPGVTRRDGSSSAGFPFAPFAPGKPDLPGGPLKPSIPAKPASP